VSEKIRGQILQAGSKPGERLVEDRLSAELGVSRVPVREALRAFPWKGCAAGAQSRRQRHRSDAPAAAELVECAHCWKR